jgi:hypothetical protein
VPFDTSVFARQELLSQECDGLLTLREGLEQHEQALFITDEKLNGELKALEICDGPGDETGLTTAVEPPGAVREVGYSSGPLPGVAVGTAPKEKLSHLENLQSAGHP